MPCLVVLLAVIAPRVVSVILWFFSSYFVKAFSDRLLLLVAGVIFLPVTTLAYAGLINYEGAIRSTFSIVVMVIAVIIDLGSLEGGRRYRA